MLVLCPVCRGSTYSGEDDCPHCGGCGLLEDNPFDPFDHPFSPDPLAVSAEETKQRDEAYARFRKYQQALEDAGLALAHRVNQDFAMIVDALRLSYYHGNDEAKGLEQDLTQLLAAWTKASNDFLGA